MSPRHTHTPSKGNEARVRFSVCVCILFTSGLAFTDRKLLHHQTFLFVPADLRVQLIKG